MPHGQCWLIYNPKCTWFTFGDASSEGKQNLIMSCVQKHSLLSSSLRVNCTLLSMSHKLLLISFLSITLSPSSPFSHDIHYTASVNSWSCSSSWFFKCCFMPQLHVLDSSPTHPFQVPHSQRLFIQLFCPSSRLGHDLFSENWPDSNYEKSPFQWTIHWKS